MAQDFTAKISVDISDLKRSMQEAKQQAALANAEFETVAATLGDWEKTSEGLNAKLSTLQKTLSSQESILGLYDAELAKIQKEYDQNAIKISTVKAKLQELADQGISKTSDEFKALESDLKAQEKALTSYERQLSNQKRAFSDAEKRAEQLRAKLQQLAQDGVSETDEEFKKFSADLKKAESAQERSATKITALNAKIVDQKERVNAAQAAFYSYAKELNDSEKELDTLTTKQNAAKKSIDDLSLKVQNQKTAIASTKSSMTDYSSKLEDITTEGKSAGKSMAGYADDVKEVDKETKSADKSSGSFRDTLASIAKTAAKALGAATVAGVAAVGTAIVKVGKEAVEAYANFEQLKGGIETLFGGSAQAVMANASKAFETAGLSANQYMETVTSFSAALISSLGGDTEKAVSMADLAITDMADNANKMGTDIESLQNAYKNFAKGQFQLLDNLALGYSGSKEGMENLLADAQAISGVEYNIDSYSDIIQAIHVIQEQFGITGATAAEAATTIQGSTAAMKSAWQNLLVGIADDNQDFDQLVTSFVDSLLTVIKNLVPRIKNVISGISKLVSGLLTELMPVISEELPALIKELLPVLIASVASLFDGLISAAPELIDILVQLIPQIVSAIVELTPKLLEAAILIFENILTGIAQMLPQILQMIIGLLGNLVTLLHDALPDLLQAAITLFMAIVQAIPVFLPKLIKMLPTIISQILDTVLKAIPQLIQAAVELFMALVDAIPLILPVLIDTLPDIINTIIQALTDYLPMMLEMSIELFMQLVQAIPQFLPQLLKMLPRIIITITQTLIEAFPTILSTAGEMFMQIANAVGNVLGALREKAESIITTIAGALRDGFWMIFNVGSDLVGGLWEGIVSAKDWVIGKVTEFGDDIMYALKDFFGIASPSKLMESEIGKNLVAGIGEGLTKYRKLATDEMDALRADLTAPIDIDVNGAKNRLAPVAAAYDAAAAQPSGTTYNFTQYNTSPKALSRLDIYRQSKNLLLMAEVS